MILKVNGVSVPTPAGQPLDIQIEVGESGETLPQVNIVATGGRLDCYASRVAKTGDIETHLFG